MALATTARRRGPTLQSRQPRFNRFTGDCTMTWETPSACDFRFGFEITMYVAAR